MIAFFSYNTGNKIFTCNYFVKTIFGANEDCIGEVVEPKMPDNLKVLISKRSNIKEFI